MEPVSLQGLSELERVRLQELSWDRLQEKSRAQGFSIARAAPTHGSAIWKKLDNFSREKKDGGPQVFGIPLARVIANDLARKQQREALGCGRRVALPLEASVMHFRTEKQKKSLRREAPWPSGGWEGTPLWTPWAGGHEG
ncbi:rho GTPase-activating protein 6-like [Tachyglossus aculeatus]|uniref:rho GTPase-activating protein 6-like n=1 Tax=Tachyglossus aculeatus TaxID=9261 RepID=UPI0018F7B099|nr:rho GTPase-activating protein 6-like [Tachyglossus aculeatus]